MAFFGTTSLLRNVVLSNVRAVVIADHGRLTVPSMSSFIRALSSSTFMDKDEVVQRILGLAKSFEKVDTSKLSPASHFEKDLGLDSLDVVEFVMALEEEFGIDIPDSEADKIHSITDAVNYVCGSPLAK